MTTYVEEVQGWETLPSREERTEKQKAASKAVAEPQAQYFRLVRALVGSTKH